MFSRDHDFSATDFSGGGSSREAIDGFSAIAAALDQGIDQTGIEGNGIADVVAIGLGWLVLAAVIFYPALQLAAIAICAAFMCMRSFKRRVLGSTLSSPEYSPAFSRRDRPSFLAV
jgi:hypothetical protein